MPALTTDQITTAVLDVLRSIAPEADLSVIEPDLPLREQLDLDSMDLLNFVIGVHEALDVDIPEIDYPRVATLGDCVAYVAAHRPVGR